MDNCDFSGYATRNDLLCGDGVTIRKDAFKGNDGCEVPLVWNHEHNDPNAVLGHAVLENRDDGVYAYGVFNDTEQGQTAKKLVQSGDVRSKRLVKTLSTEISGSLVLCWLELILEHTWILLWRILLRAKRRWKYHGMRILCSITQLIPKRKEKTK